MIDFVKKHYLQLIFITAEAVMFCLIFFSELAINITSYLSICICLLYALITFDKTTDRLFLTLGLVFTAGADTFLVLLSNGNKVIAMCLFFMAQTMYFIRLINVEKLKKIRVIILTASGILVLTAAAATVSVLKTGTDALAIISTIYYAMLISNIIFAFVNFKTVPLFAAGLVLFAMCDLVIGLGFLRGYIDISDDSIISKIVSAPINLAWIFYLPSQVLIALSRKREITLSKLTV